MKIPFVRLVFSAALLLLPLAGRAFAQTQALETFYRTNGLQIVVGYGPGAAYDVYARLLARHIGRHLPGNPNVVVQNMPGAGSMKAANYIYNLAPKDGSQIAMFARGLGVQPLLDAQGVQFEPTKLGWLGSIAEETSVAFAWSGRGFNSFEDTRAKPMVVPATGTGADSAIYPQVLNAVLGTKFKIISGYQDANATMLAIERGEADGSVGTSWSTLTSSHPGWITSGQVKVLVQFAMRKGAEFKDVPLVLDLASNDADRQVLELIFSRQAMAYPVTAPPGLALEKLKALRAAFEATTRDEAFLEDAKRLGVQVQPVSGEEIGKMLTRLFSSSPQTIERARAAASGEKRAN